MGLHTKSLVLLAVAVVQTFGAIYNQASQLPAYSYDYVIVGGGAAGPVIANRLTENPNVQVLLLEAGGGVEGDIFTIVPLLAPFVGPNTTYDWNYTTSSQPGLNGRSVPVPRGKILGGSTTTNYMVYNTGSRDDWDYISRITDDPSWTWDAMAPYRDLNQKYVPPNDHHDDTNQYLPDAHSRNGMVSISLPGYTWPIDSRIYAATNDPGFSSEFPFRRDMNTGDPIGFGWVQGTIGDGQRSSSATSYVGPDYINRPNLHILLHAQVTKLLEESGSRSKTPRFNRVEFAAGPSSQKLKVTARKEVILSAGAIGTPQILMLSGIGDPDELESLGIDTRVKLPSVGKNMTDHLFVVNSWQLNATETIETYLAPDELTQNIAEWNQTHQGPLSWTFVNQMAWKRLPENDTILQTYGDPTVGPTSAHYQVIFSNAWQVVGVPKPPGNWMTISTNLISPTSRGTIKLASADPFAAPIIDPNFFSTDFDIKTIVSALKLVKQFATAPSLQGFVGNPWEELAAATTDEQLAQYARNHASVGFHNVGTASISRREDSWGVVDPDLKVKGTKGLRIVDASALPYVPSGHTQGPVYLLAELAAAKIKAEW